MQVLTSNPLTFKPRKEIAGQEPRQALQAENPILAQAVDGLYTARHVWLDNLKDGVGSTAGGVMAGVTAVGALGLGVARLRSDALPDKIDGVGLLAASAHSALEAWSVLGGRDTSDLVMGPLKAVHGLATVGVGVSELVRAPREGPPQRYLVGAFAITQGLVLTGAACLPNLAPALHLVAGGAFAAKEVALHWRKQEQGAGL